ncbi:MAG: hypothetical protein ACXVB0_10455 [Mucilaginibacter sp.]
MEGFKKHRGLRRYYKNLTTKIDLENIDRLDFDSRQSWFENWFLNFKLPPYGNNQTWFYHFHLHFDRRGYGNNSFKRRRPHLDKLFRHFDILAAKTKNLETEFHLYAILLDHDSYSDALFLHPPRLNTDQFRYKISDLELTTTLTNKSLNDYIDNLDGYEKRYGQADEAFCFIFKKNVGQPFG